MTLYLNAEERRALRRAYRMLSIQPGQFLLALLCGVLCLGASVALAGVSAWLIARASQMPPVLSLQVAAVGVRTFGVTRALMRYLQRIFSHRVALNGMDSLRLSVYDSLAKGSIDRVARIQRGDLLARIGHDIDEVGNLIVRSILPILVAVIVSIGTIFATACLSVPVAISLTLCMLLSGLVGPILTARSARKAESIERKERTSLSVAIVNLLDSADELRVAGSYQAHAQETVQVAANLEAAKGKADRPAAIAIMIDNLAIGLSVVAALLIGIPETNVGMVAAVALAVLVLMPLSSFEGLSEISSATVQLIKSAQAAKRIVDLLGPEDEMEQKQAAAKVDKATNPTPAIESSKTSSSKAISTAKATDSPESIKPGKPQLDPVLQVRDLQVGWPGGETIVQGLDLELRPGDVVGVVGPSGVGKTTLLYTLAGMLPPKGGTATLGGQPIWGMDRQQSTSVVQLTTEDAHVFGTTVFENLRVGNAGLEFDRAEQVLTQVGLGGWVKSLPDGIHTMLGANNTSISGGEKRRLLMARALANPAPLMLLDEPTEHLDAANAEVLVGRLLEEAQHGRGILLVTHHLSILNHVDTIISIVPTDPEIGTGVGSGLAASLGSITASGSVTSSAMDAEPREPARVKVYASYAELQQDSLLLSSGVSA